MNLDSIHSPTSSTENSQNSINQSVISDQTEIETMAASNNNNSGSFSEPGAGGISIRKFTGKNYLQWSQSVQMFITGRSKGDYLTGATARPAESEPTFTKWNNDDNQVRFWLISTMEPDLGDNYLLHKTAKDIWDDVKETYSTQDNSSALFEVESKLFNFKQGDLSATDYYNRLIRTWLQLDLYEAQTWDTTKDAKTFRTYLEKKRTVQMLLGLNQDLDAAKSRVMGTKPFPSLKEAFAEILREEDRRRLMIGEPKLNSEGSALITETPAAALISHANRNKGRPTMWMGKPIPEGTTWCDHCNKPFHTKEVCWDIHGKPAGWKPKSELRRTRALATTSKGAEEEAQFSKGQVDALQKMLAQALKQDKPEHRGYITSLFDKQGDGDGEDNWQW